MTTQNSLELTKIPLLKEHEKRLKPSEFSTNDRAEDIVDGIDGK
jgi:hypothetical protein